MQLKLLIIFIIALALIPSTVTALGIQKAEFFDVEQGDTYNITINVYTSYLDFKNDYTIEMEGEIVGWLKLYMPDLGSASPHDSKKWCVGAT